MWRADILQTVGRLVTLALQAGAAKIFRVGEHEHEIMQEQAGMVLK